MTKSLIITEKPSVARDIVDALGGFGPETDGYFESDRYLCTYAVGHVLELLEPEEIDPIYKRWQLSNLPILPDEFKLKPKSGQNERIRVIKKLMNRADVNELINACDAGREGELIFRELVKFIESDKPIRRLWLQSMTTQAIQEGFKHLEDGRKFEGLAAAAECRSLADWLIGMNASRALTIRLRSKAHKGAWSAGRVQTPTLALLVERELEVLSHIPETYWRATATFDAGSHRYQGTWYDPNFQADENRPQLKADRIFEEAKALAVVEEVRGRKGNATETRRPSREAAPPLFDLTSLQRECNRRFGWSAARALSAAQRCYESHKVLTYPRTDSRCLPTDYVGEVDRVVQALASVRDFQASARYLMQNGRQNESKIFNNAGVSDHFAIIPTGQRKTNLTGDDQKLYDLVVRRFLAAFFPPAVWEQVERKTIVGPHYFQSRSRTLKEPGWRSVMNQTADEEGSQPLPALDADPASVAAVDVQAEAEATKPPPRITEARLLSLMENAGKQIEDEELAAALHEKGLGTPATRADTIENLKSKQYVDRSLRPTVKGMRLIDLLQRIHAGRLTSAELTGELELHLRQVELGERSAGEFMSEIVDYTKDVVEKASSFNYDDIYPDKEPLGNCPLCKRPVFERAWFYRCKPDPSLPEDQDCKFRIWKDKSGRYIDRETVHVLLRDGKTGELDGFVDRRGRTYKGVLVVEDANVALKPVAGSEQAAVGDAAVLEFPVNPEPLGPCPIAEHENCQVVETPTDFLCETRKQQMESGESKPKGLLLPRIVCKREITRDDALEYIKSGQTPLIEDFISRFGRPFKATLKLNPETGRHTFEFPPRPEGARGRGRFGKKKEVVEGELTSPPPTKAGKAKKTPAKKKAAVKKTKKAPAKGTARKTKTG